MNARAELRGRLGAAEPGMQGAPTAPGRDPMPIPEHKPPASAPACDASPRLTRLEVVHETHYAYAAPVSLSHHVAHLQPLDAPGQRLLGCRIEIDPMPSFRLDTTDVFGNACSHFELTVAHHELRVRATSHVALSPRFEGLQPAASPSWEAVARRLHYQGGRAFEPAAEFAAPSPYVPRLAALRAWARPSFGACRAVALAALELMHRLHAEWTYASRSTDVDTPLAEVFDSRHGVCQDFAHLLIGALRMMGLAARYVSGYLLTQPVDAAPALVGADASHAWVQVWCPDTPGLATDGWLGLDPTNDLVPGVDHVRVAVGRDYGDVAPLRGVIRGGGRHTLGVAVTTRRLDAAQDDGPVVALDDAPNGSEDAR